MLVFNPSSFGWQILPSLLIQPLVWQLLILAQQTICFRTSLPSSLTSTSLIFKSIWVTIPFFLCWAGAQSSSPSTVNMSLSRMPFISPVCLCRCTSFGPILNSLAAVFWAPPSQVCWSTFHLLSYLLTLHPTATSPMSPLALRLRWRVSITFNVNALLCSILRN